MTKRYETKVCHFAHHPDRTGNAPECHRVANGADSADHLFIKRDVTAWLASQGLRAQAELRNLGHGPGDAVDFWLPATHQRLRFQLSHQDYRSWYRAEQELGTSAEQVSWAFGAEGPISANMVQRQGYALRVRCETSGSDRRVLIGIEHAGRQVSWSALVECRFTAGGLLTPVLEDLLSDGSVTPRGKNAWLRPATFPLRGDQIVFAIDAEAPTPKQSPLAEAGRYLITADVKAAGSRIIRAHVSLPDDMPMPTEQYVYRLQGAARLLLAHADPQSGVEWALRVDGMTQLSGIEAERTGLWRPGVALPEPVRAELVQTEPVRAEPAAPLPARRKLAAERPPVAPTKADAGHPDSAEPSNDSTPRADRETADRVREALKDFAQRRTPSTWSTLGVVAEMNLAWLSAAERRDLLIMVDRPIGPDKPILSALVRDGSGRPLPDMRSVIQGLGLGVPGDDVSLKLWCDRETERAYEAHSASRTGMLPSRPERVADGKRFQPPGEGQPTSRWTSHRPDTPAHRGALEEGAERLSQALASAQGLLPLTSGPQHTRLSKAIKKARARLDAHHGAKEMGTAYLDWLSGQTDSPGDEAQILMQTIKDVKRHAVRGPVAKAAPLESARSAPPPAKDVPGPPEPPIGEMVSASPEHVAAEQFDTLVDEFRAAQQVRDFDRAEQVYRKANPVYRLRLSPALQHQRGAVVAEMRKWIGEQQSNSSSALLKRFRQLLHRMGAEKGIMTTEDLADVLTEAEALSKRITLPESEQRAFDTWQRRLKALRESKKSAQAQSPSRTQRR